MTNPDLERLAVNEVFADSNQIIGVVDPSLVVRWISRSAEVYGLDVLGRSIADVIHADDLERATQAFDGTALAPGFEPSLMATSIVPIRLMTPNGVVPFAASGRWTRDDDGHLWLVAILRDVTTRFATDRALRRLAAGSNEHQSIRAVIAAARDYGGVQGAQMIWEVGRSQQTLGDMGPLVAPVLGVVGNVSDLPSSGRSLVIEGSDWAFLLPVGTGNDALGAMALWGIGRPPDLEFIRAAMAPLIDLAALSLRRVREHAELERLATTDQVTGLLNRHGFFSALDRLVDQSAVMYIDLDGFKTVNDQFGHTMGDRLLSVVARRLSDALGDGDIAGRIGGDEFAVLCRSASPAEVRAAGERIVGALNQTFVIDGHRIVTGASVGMAYSNSALRGRPLLDQADQALLEAKAQGKGRSVMLSTFD